MSDEQKLAKANAMLEEATRAFQESRETIIALRAQRRELARDIAALRATNAELVEMVAEIGAMFDAHKDDLPVYAQGIRVDELIEYGQRIQSLLAKVGG